MKYMDIGRHRALFKGYTELRIQENSSRTVSLLNGDVVGNTSSSQAGLSARSYARGAWGMASTPELNDAGIAHCINRAWENAEILGRKAGKKSYDFDARPGRTVTDTDGLNPMPDQKALISFARELDAYCKTRFPRLSSRSLSISCLDMEKNLLTSDGAEAWSLTPRSMIYAEFTTEYNGEPVELYTVAGGGSRFGNVFKRPEDLFPELDRLWERLEKKALGQYAKPGIHDVVLGTELAGILAHEAIGHTVEADLVLGGSVAADYLHREVASPLVSLTDFANTALGEPCPVPIWTDDEGTLAEDAVIIDRGILRSYMHSKESAARMGHRPTGNARAFSFTDEPLIRMRNTAILPGKDKLEEMIASIDNGYFLLQPSNGQADTTSEFMFGIVEGYEIRNGKIGQAVKDCTISGVAFEMLKTVSMVSDEMSWTCAGMCGKKQSIPVGMGGPAVRCRINIGGRS